MANAAILCGAVERIECSVESRNAFTTDRFDSDQSLSHVFQLQLKTVCKSMRSASDPMRTGSYQEYKLYALHLWVTTWLSQGQVVQGHLFRATSALEYASKFCCLEESKKEDEEGLVKSPDACWKVTFSKVFKKVLKNNLGSNKGIHGNLLLLLHVKILQVEILHFKQNSLFPITSVSLTPPIASSVSMLRSSTHC